VDVQVHTAQLHSALERGLHAMEHFGFLGSLDAVYLYGEGTALTLTFDGGIRTLVLRVAGSVVTSGGIQLPLERFATIIARLPATVVRLNTDASGQQIQMTSHNLDLTLRGKAISAAPALPSPVRWIALGHCSAQALANALEQVGYAIGQNERRPALNGTCFQVRSSQLLLTAADGFRLAHTGLVLHTPAEQPQDLIIGRNDVTILISLLNWVWSAVAILALPSSGTILIHTADVDYAFRAMHEEYPDLSRSVPGIPNTSAVIATQSLRDMVQLIGCLGFLEGYGVFLELVPNTSSAPGRVILTASTAEGVSVRGICEGLVEGQPRSFRLNTTYVMDALAVIRTTHVCIEMAEHENVLFLRPIGFPDDWHLIMPMKQP